MSDLDLTTRAGLPEALRVLLEVYPRAGWSNDPNFDDLIQFWLERHLMFRRLLDTLTTDTQAQLDRDADPQIFAKRLSHLGGMLFNELHMHHQIEDTHYFPVLRKHDARLDQGFEILDRDHHSIDPRLETFATAANGVLSPQPASRDALATLHSELSGLEKMLNRHLEDEEELIVPVLLKFGHSGL